MTGEMVGETIGGRYRTLRVLGVGGMGAVYEAEHIGTGRRVAVKVIHANMAGKAEMVLRFQREARAAGAIETPHIVQVLDTGSDDKTGVVYMVMEFLRGEDMSDLVKRLRRVPWRVALKLIGQACTGLGKAHAAGVVHRDIKPANLFLSIAEGGAVTVKVVDFGIAKIMVEGGSGEDASLTRTGGILGSPLYMSPEQATGRKSIDHRTDIWSLGVVLYQALTGRVPHESDTLGALILAICSEHAPPIQDVAPWVSSEVAELVHRTMLHDPASRFQSMSALLTAIQHLVPGPLTVTADELVPVSPEEQAIVAPREQPATPDTSTPAPGGPASGPSMLGTPASAAPAVTTPQLGASAVTAPGAVSESVSLGVSVAQGTGATPAGGGRGKLVAGAGLALVLAGGIGAYQIVGRRAGTPAGTPQIAAAELAPSVTASATATPTQAPAAIVSPAVEQTVKVAIDPPDAIVEVDGRPTPIVDGSVEILGVIGSAHHLRIVKDQRETSAEVAITSRGAVPAKVQFDTPGAKPLQKPGGGKPAPTALPTAKPRNQALDGRFE